MFIIRVAVNTVQGQDTEYEREKTKTPYDEKNNNWILIMSGILDTLFVPRHKCIE